nr:pupal cuticle protein Edg-78E-like [Penaeus vannamei]
MKGCRYTKTLEAWRILLLLVGAATVLKGAAAAGGGAAATDASGRVVVSFQTADQEQFQFGRPGEAVFGAYSWTSPEGYQLVFRYVADSSGFRVMGDAVPVDSEGVAANGEQVNPVTPNDGFVLS